MSQNDMILNYLLEGNSITGIEALKMFGCFRLASRINELKKRGYRISVEMIDNLETNKRYAQYFFMPQILNWERRRYAEKNKLQRSEDKSMAMV